MSTQDELIKMGGGLLTDIAIGAITDFLKRRREAGEDAADLTAAERDDVTAWVEAEQVKMDAKLDSAPRTSFAEDRAEGRDRAEKP